ncbi:MAG: M23 family metallopeptidase [Moorea sp. SIO2B7]|nr:M23 family metallopeptidase [Moorena sp. SIO2B7]
MIFSGWEDSGLGNVVKLKHIDGSFSIYGHNSHLLVKGVQKVQQGQIIAKMGNTGNSTGPHVHFETYTPEGKIVNPMTYLPPLVGGKIPQPRTIAFTRRRTESGCEKETIMAGETVHFWINICRENGKLFYFGQSKQNPPTSIWLPVLIVGVNQYRANNGNTSFYITPNRLEMRQNGRRLFSERLRLFGVGAQRGQGFASGSRFPAPINRQSTGMLQRNGD